MMPGGLLEDDPDEDSPIQQRLHARSRPRNLQKIDGPIRVDIRNAFKNFIKTHMSDSSEEEMTHMERMFVAMLSKISRAHAPQQRQADNIVCYSCGGKGHHSTKCPLKAQRLGGRRMTPCGQRD